MSTQLLLFLRAWSVLIRYGQQCGWLVQDQHSTTMLRPTPCQSHFVQSGASSSSRTKGFQMDLFKASCIFCIYSLLNLFIFLGCSFVVVFFNKKIKQTHEPCWIYFQICLFTTWISIIHFTLPYLSFNYNTFSDACYDWYIKAGEPSVSPRDLNRNKLLKYKCLKFLSVIMLKQGIKVDTSFIIWNNLYLWPNSDYHFLISKQRKSSFNTRALILNIVEYLPIDS